MLRRRVLGQLGPDGPVTVCVEGAEGLEVLGHVPEIQEAGTEVQVTHSQWSASHLHHSLPLASEDERFEIR